MRACFAQSVPPRISAGGSYARAALLSATRADGVRLQPYRDSLRLDGVRAGDCIDYRVDLSATLRGNDTGRRVGSSLLTNSGEWLWTDPSPTREAIELSFEMPRGMRVSGPWQPIEGAPLPSFRLVAAPIEWENHVAFGRFRTERLAVPGGELRVAILDEGGDADVPALGAWLTEAARAVATLYGRFPLQSTQVVIIPRVGLGAPVRWGEVARGGAPAALFVVDSAASRADLRSDWTAAHELSHLLLPYVTRNDAWASEGFASYYQNVLRARAGMLTQSQGWERLEAGFSRGRRATRSGTLREASRGGHGQTMRVYWAGAAVALRLDVELRRASAGKHSLDSVLAALRECCLAHQQTWSARELFARFDQLSGTDIAGRLYAQYSAAEDFPAVDDLYRDLGISFRNGRVTFDATAPQAALRAAIMLPAPATPVMR